jgi:hypothetical protein
VNVGVGAIQVAQRFVDSMRHCLTHNQE